MEPRISLITLGVADVARSRAFYEALGWRASSASTAEVAFFQGNGLALALWSRAALRRIRYERELPARRAFVGESVEIGFRLSNLKLLPVPWIE